MGIDAFVQHRLVIEARNRGEVGVGSSRQSVELDCEHGAKPRERVEQARPVAAVPAAQNHAQTPRPDAVGSPSQPGGVSQTNARMAITQRSYGSVPRSSRQNSARQRNADTRFEPTGMGRPFSTRYV